MPSDRQGWRECRNGRSIFRPWHFTVVVVDLCCLFSSTELSVDDVNRQLLGIREDKGICSADPPRQGWRGGAPKDGFTACRRSGPFVRPLQSNQIDQLFTLFGIIPLSQRVGLMDSRLRGSDGVKLHSAVRLTAPG